jgi:hypothetical protein
LEFVIGGYNFNAGSFNPLAGYYQDYKLMFAGKVRQGLNAASRAPYSTGSNGSSGAFWSDFLLDCP